MFVFQLLSSFILSCNYLHTLCSVRSIPFLVTHFFPILLHFGTPSRNFLLQARSCSIELPPKKVFNMQLRDVLTTALTAAPLAVSAAGTLGFAVGNTNPDGSCKVQSDFESDFAAIQSNTDATLVRTYSSSDSFGNPCNTPSEVLPAAKSAGIKVLLGMW